MTIAAPALRVPRLAGPAPLSGRLLAPALCLPATLLLLGCASSGVVSHTRSSTVDFLFPDQAAAQPATDVRLELPLRIGVAFAPAGGRASWGYGTPLHESEAQALLDRVAEAFRTHRAVGSIEVIPDTYLRPGGSFDNLQQVGAALGIDLVCLVSHDQLTISEQGNESILYATVVGAWFVRGERNETRTLMDASVFDITSRALLFRASGDSSLVKRSTLVEIEKKARRLGRQGFSDATDALIEDLHRSLAEFSEQAKSGTVRGVGTPKLEVVRRASSGGGGGAFDGLGAFGWPEGLSALLLAAAALALERGRRG